MTMTSCTWHSGMTFFNDALESHSARKPYWRVTSYQFVFNPPCLLQTSAQAPVLHMNPNRPHAGGMNRRPHLPRKNTARPRPNERTASPVRHLDYSPPQRRMSTGGLARSATGPPQQMPLQHLPPAPRRSSMSIPYPPSEVMRPRRKSVHFAPGTLPPVDEARPRRPSMSMREPTFGHAEALPLQQSRPGMMSRGSIGRLPPHARHQSTNHAPVGRLRQNMQAHGEPRPRYVPPEALRGRRLQP